MAWSSKIVGDTQQYTKGEGTITFAHNVVRSLRWPGAVTVSKGGKFVNIYVGLGIKHGDTSYKPVEPGDVLEDPSEPKEMPEPNPKDAPPEKLEDDTGEKDGEEDEEDD